MAQQITVLYSHSQLFTSDAPNDEKEIVVTIPPAKHVVCCLKRAIQRETQVPPEEQRLTLNGNTDDFEISPTVRCERRLRTAEHQITIHSFNLEEYPVYVDHHDTILDLKFLLGQQLQEDAENIRLWINGTPLPNDVTVQDCGALNPECLLKIQFFYPSNEPGHGEIHRSTSDNLHLVIHQGVNTLCKSFRRAAREYRDYRCLGTRSFLSDGSRGPYEWITYGQAEMRVNNIAAGLVHLGAKKGDSVGIISVNRAEWQLTDTACFTQSFVSVPLYDTFGPEAMVYIINLTDIHKIVCSKEVVPQLLEAQKSCPSIENIIVMDDLPGDKAWIDSESSTKFMPLSELERLGAVNPVVDIPPAPDDLATIQFTSGTTGNPKGVMVTHDNFIVASAGLTSRIPEEENIDGEQCYLSYLPLAHSYGRLMEISMLSRGNAIGYFQGNLLKLVDDVQALGPTFFPGVPRVWQRVYDAVTGEVAKSSFIRQWIFNKAYETQRLALETGEERSGFWDKIVFQKVCSRFGGNLRLVTSGAAPISAKVANFLKVALDAHFVEGYGLSETNSAGTSTSFDDTEFGHVGTPLPVNEIKLVSVPEMDYLVTDKPEPRGEICIRGTNIFQGYFKMPEKTAEVLGADGWFKTGDVGKWRLDGNLQIIDRKKNIFKLAQGEYIRPEYIENIIKMNKHVTNAFVYGESLHTYLVGIIVPDFDQLSSWINENGLDEEAKDVEALCENEKLKLFLLDELKRIGDAEGLKGFEHVRKLSLVPDDFTVESGLLTPSQKLKRHDAKMKFLDKIKSMYESPLPLVQSKL